MRSVNSRLLTAAGVVLAATASAGIAAPPDTQRFKACTHSPVVRVGSDEAYEDRRNRRHDRDRGPVVDAPFAHVDAGDPVIVDAPGTHVGVHRGHVHVVAPFVNLWIPR